MPDTTLPEKILPQAGYQRSDVGARTMLIAGVLMLAALGAVVALAAWLYPASTSDGSHQLQLPRPAEPVLQDDTAADMQRFYAQEMAKLNNPGWIDPSQGRVHIPIADAMRDVARTGIADWPASPRRVER